MSVFCSDSLLHCDLLKMDRVLIGLTVNRVSSKISFSVNLCLLAELKPNINMKAVSTNAVVLATVVCLLVGFLPHSQVEARRTIKTVLGLGLLGAAIAPRFVPVPIPEYEI